MGLSSRLHDVSDDSLPLLLLVAFAASFSYLRSFLSCLSHHQDRASPAEVGGTSSLAAHLGSGLSGLAFLADHLASNPSFPFSSSSICSSTAEQRAADDLERSERDGCSWCAVCLSGFADRERVRRLPCRHAFHGGCIEGWFLHQMNLSCPLCRSPLPAPEHPAVARGQIGAELVAWFSP